MHLKQISTTGALTTHLILNGSAGSDVIYIVDQTVTMCGSTFKPFIAGDFMIGLDGKGGNDLLDGSSMADLIFGSDGNDWLYSSKSDSHLSGNGGNDVLTAYGASASVDGGAGDDIACAQAPNHMIGSMTGGSNVSSTPGDRRCGFGEESNTGWESLGCQYPCF